MYLSPGDKVAIIATAKNFDAHALDYAIATICSWGLIPVKGQHLYQKHFQFAGNDDERRKDLQWSIDHPDIKAIFCARGGYGTTRIIDKIDLQALHLHPKWLIGFSDITALHFALQKQHHLSIHGPMPINFEKNAEFESLDQLKAILFGEFDNYQSFAGSPYNRSGKGEGLLIGGNLTLIHNMIGTSSDLDFSEKILFIEEVGEYLYHIDRIMTHLKRAGKLQRLHGLILGHFSGMKDNDQPFGHTWQEIILDAVKDYDFPVAFNFPAGHEGHNNPLILGSRANLRVTGRDDSELRYSLYSTSNTV